MANLKRCFQIVTEVNQELYEIAVEHDPKVQEILEEYTLLSATTNGYEVVIQFLGIDLWNSADDNRPYINEDDPDRCIQVELKGWIKKRTVAYLKLMSDVNKLVEHFQQKGKAKTV